MGGIKSRILRPILRPIKMFNIDNRVAKVISKSKPTPAPTYESTYKQLEIARSINPNFMREHYKKDAKLDDNLKKIYVTSTDEQLTPEPPIDQDKLPHDRHISEDFEYGFWQPKTVPAGKLTVKTLLEMLCEYQMKPIINNKKVLAKKYNIDEGVVEQLISNFRVLTKVELESSDKKEKTMVQKLNSALDKLVGPDDEEIEKLKKRPE